MLKNWHVYVAFYFHLVRDDIILETRSGMKIKVRAGSTDLMAFTNVWILQEYHKPGFEIKYNDTIIDIGAHAGFFALYAAQYCNAGHIFCFEPVSDNFDLLAENIRINKLTNVTCCNNAVSNQDKIVRIYLNSTDQAAHSIYGIGKEYIESAATTLNDIINVNGIKVVNFLKLDCEGSEYDILQATSNEHMEKIQKICLEYHILKDDYEPLNLLKNRLLSLNFRIIDSATTSDLGILYASK